VGAADARREDPGRQAAEVVVEQDSSCGLGVHGCGKARGQQANDKLVPYVTPGVAEIVRMTVRARSIVGSLILSIGFCPDKSLDFNMQKQVYTKHTAIQKENSPLAIASIRKYVLARQTA
jgi:hypothetical protein